MPSIRMSIRLKLTYSMLILLMHHGTPRQKLWPIIAPLKAIVEYYIIANPIKILSARDPARNGSVVVRVPSLLTPVESSWVPWSDCSVQLLQSARRP